MLLCDLLFLCDLCVESVAAARRDDRVERPKAAGRGLAYPVGLVPQGRWILTQRSQRKRRSQSPSGKKPRMFKSLAWSSRESRLVSS